VSHVSCAVGVCRVRWVCVVSCRVVALTV
jgi:hypothetical protein